MKVCHHVIERSSVPGNRAWNSYRWCSECKVWFWFGDKRREPKAEQASQLSYQGTYDGPDGWVMVRARTLGGLLSYESFHADLAPWEVGQYNGGN